MGDGDAKARNETSVFFFHLLLEQTTGVHQSPSMSKNVARNSSTPAIFQSNARDNGTEQKV